LPQGPRRPVSLSIPGRCYKVPPSVVTSENACDLARQGVPVRRRSYTWAALARDLAREGVREALCVGVRDGRLGISEDRVDAREDDVVAGVEAGIVRGVEHPDLRQARGLRPPRALHGEGAAGPCG